MESGAKEGLILSGDLIAERARDRVHIITMRLKNSIKRGNPFKTSRGMAISVGSNVEYAADEEFREGEKHGTSHAYLRPALDMSRKEVIVLAGKKIVAKMVRR
jgi:hypothetical protein